MNFAAGSAKQEKSSTAKVASLRMNDGKGESGGDGRIDGISARMTSTPAREASS